MSRITDCFSDLQKRGKKALIPYLTAGDPNVTTTLGLMHALVANGADLTVKDATGRTALDAARGAGGARGGADAFPKTVVLLESVMKAKGLAVPGR